MKNIIMFLLLFVSVSLNAQVSKKVTRTEYVDMGWKYAKAITTNKSPEFASFHGELGEDDENLQVFVLEKREGMFWVFVEQGDLLDGDILVFYPMTIPDTTDMYVYPARYSSPLLLYEIPSRDLLKEKCETYISGPMRIIGVCGTWLKVEFEVYGKRHDGWIPREEYCPNPYSTCS